MVTYLYRIKNSQIKHSTKLFWQRKTKYIKFICLFLVIKDISVDIKFLSYLEKGEML